MTFDLEHDLWPHDSLDLYLSIVYYISEYGAT